ncbi:MAG: addiction module protein [Verrucomicrobiota bacterium]|nr:addiction module protein [Verrucomicrobiota bacterium]
MTTVEMENVLNMPRREKLQMMEMLWEDLTRKAEEQETPSWHQQTLKETEQRVVSGDEAVINWADAKQQLRARCRVFSFSVHKGVVMSR